jgi:hypothetical protein
MFGNWFGSAEEPTPTQPPLNVSAMNMSVAAKPRESASQHTYTTDRPNHAPLSNLEPGIGNFPYQIGGASAEMCNALVAAAGDPSCSDMQRRRRVLHCLDLGVPVDHEDPDGMCLLVTS